MRTVTTAVGILFLLGAVGLDRPALGNSPPLLDRDFYVPNKSVSDIVERDGVIYLAGSFNYVGPHTGSAVPVDAVTGEALSHPGVGGRSTEAVATDNEGGWYLGGRSRLSRLNSDLSRMEWGPSVVGEIYAIAAGASAVFVSGSFSEIGGVPRDGLAAIDPVTSEVLPWNPSSNGQVRTLAVYGNTLYAGGVFTEVNGQARENIASFDISTGALTSWNPGTNRQVTRLVTHGGRLYVAGTFSSIDGTLRYSVAAFDAATGELLPWAPFLLGGLVLDLAATDSRVFAAGAITAFADGQVYYNIVALDATTGETLPWNTWVASDDYMSCVAANESTVYVAGDFDWIAGETRRGVAALDAQTAELQDWGFELLYPSDFRQTPDTVIDLECSDSTVLVAGRFDMVGGEVRRGVAALDAATGRPTPWDLVATFFFPVVFRELEISDDTVYAIGALHWAVNFGWQGILSASPRGPGPGASWGHGYEFGVHFSALELVGDTVFVGGSFSELDKVSRESLAALDAATGTVLPWRADVDGIVYSLIAVGGRVLVGGDFTSIGGEPRNNLAAVDVASGAVLPWNPDVDGRVLDMVCADDVVYLGGSFNAVGGAPRDNIAAVDLDTGLPTAWRPDADRAVYDLAYRGDGLIFVGGDFDHIGGQSRTGAAALAITSGDATPWDPGLDEAVGAITPVGSRILLGGSFREVAGQDRPRLATVGSSIVTPVVFDKVGNTAVPRRSISSAALDLVVPNPARAPVRIAFTLPNAGSVRLQVFDVRGREVADLASGWRPAGRSELTWAGHRSRPASGVYFVRLETEHTIVTDRVVLRR